MSHYTHHVAMVIPKGRKQAATQTAERVGRTSDFDTFDDFFSVPLSPSGNEPATHYGCHTAMREVVHQKLPSIRAGIPGARYKTTEKNGERVASFDDLLAEMGLQRIQTDDPNMVDE